MPLRAARRLLLHPAPSPPDPTTPASSTCAGPLPTFQQTRRPASHLVSYATRSPAPNPRPQGVFGSPELFIGEYRCLLATQLLGRTDYEAVRRGEREAGWCGREGEGCRPVLCCGFKRIHDSNPRAQVDIQPVVGWRWILALLLHTAQPRGALPWAASARSPSSHPPALARRGASRVHMPGVDPFGDARRCASCGRSSC